MEYGCIGEHLPHSFSKEIHESIGSYKYELKELRPDEIESFMLERDFKAINVTIPYKQTVIPYLSRIDPPAELTGAVNTIVNRGGELYGYNTDVIGLSGLIRRAGVTLKGKKTLILGTGGTSRTALAVARTEGAREAIKVGRTKKDGCVTYDEAYSLHADAEIIINTTPCGMFPEPEGCPIEPERFEKLEAVFDAVYNPLETVLVRKARRLGAKAENGLYMLASQAVAAYGIFMGVETDEDLSERVYKNVLVQKENIVLTGMPGSGKTTVGRLLAGKEGREFVDTDELIVAREKREISDIFASDGEEYFRDVESEVIREISMRNGLVISTGGGAILRQGNVELLKMNGRLFFLDRPLEQLLPTEDRPLANTIEAMKKRYEERYDKYLASADHVIDTAGDPMDSIRQIEEKHG